jgi:hypothetical protein
VTASAALEHVDVRAVDGDESVKDKGRKVNEASGPKTSGNAHSGCHWKGTFGGYGGVVEGNAGQGRA